MIDFSGSGAYYGKPIPSEKLFGESIVEEYQIEEMVWLMSIKPGIRNVECFTDGRNRMEEIEVLSIRVKAIPDIGGPRKLLRLIHSKISYPVVVFFEYKEKYKIAAWKYITGARDINKNILQTSYISSWIYEPQESEKTMKCVEEVSDLLMNGEGSIKELYDRICASIGACYPQHIGSKEHLSKLLYDLTGLKNPPVINKIDTTKIHGVSNPDQRFKKKKYTSTYHYSYEYEDIWHALMNDEMLSQIIQKRRYRDAEDMVFSIDSKYAEQPDGL